MKTIIKNLIRILILILPLLFLSACDARDEELLVMAWEAWAEENGIFIDGEWQPDGVVTKVVKDTVGNITNTDVKVQFDGLDVVHDIDETKAMAAVALETFDTGKMTLAVSRRPLDWSLLEQEGVVWLANDNGAAALTSFTQSDELLREQLLSGGDCATLRRAQLETRLGTLWEAVLNYESQSGRSQGDAVALREEHDRVGSELWLLNNGKSEFCGL